MGVYGPRLGCKITMSDPDFIIGWIIPYSVCYHYGVFILLLLGSKTNKSVMVHHNSNVIAVYELKGHNTCSFATKALCVSILELHPFR